MIVGLDAAYVVRTRRVQNVHQEMKRASKLGDKSEKFHQRSSAGASAAELHRRGASHSQSIKTDSFNLANAF